MNGDERSRDVPPPEEPALDMGPLRDDVGFQIHITRRAIWNALRSSRRKMKRRKPSGYMSSLLLIGTNPGVSPSEIAAALAMDMPNMVQIVRMLEEAGLVERKSDSSDRRRLSLSLTAAGWEQFAEVVKISQSQSRKISSRMSEEELGQLIELLGKVRASLSAFEHESPGESGDEPASGSSDAGGAEASLTNARARG
jgi:DNA-binding MarR family transcriptional regulator